MQFSSVVLASMAVSAASALSYVTVTNDGATYVETIVQADDLSTPAGAYISSKVITGTKGDHTYTKTIWNTVFTSSAEAEASATEAAESAEAPVASEPAETSEAAESQAAETSEAVETSEVAQSTQAAESAVVSSYEGAAGNLGVAAGVAGFAGVAALLI